MFEQPENLSLESQAEKQDPARRKVMESLERIGHRERLDDSLIDRLARLEKDSFFNEDARTIERGFGRVLDFMEKEHAISHSRLILAREHRQDGRVASILHDVGKSGPAGATPEQQAAVIKVFALEEIRDEKLQVVEAVRKSLDPEEAEKAIAHLQAAGIDPLISMRKFWDLHAQWTHDILEAHPDGLSQHARIIAGSHHIDHGVNPYNLPEGELPLQASLIGTLEEYVDALESRILIVIDKYEASNRRSKFKHEEAIAWVRENLKKFKDDPLMMAIIDAVDQLGKKNALFAYDNIVEPPKPRPKAPVKKESEGYLVFYS